MGHGAIRKFCVRKDLYSELLNMKRKGITIFELSLAMLVTSMVVIVLVAAYIAGSSVFNSEMNTSDSLLEANKGLGMMTRDLRNCYEIMSAGPAQITFWFDDLNQNESREAEEIVTYSWNGTVDGNITRSVTPDTYSITKHVRELVLTYDSATLADIRQVNIKLTVGVGDSTTTLESSVRPRNI